MPDHLISFTFVGSLPLAGAALDCAADKVAKVRELRALPPHGHDLSGRSAQRGAMTAQRRRA